MTTHSQRPVPSVTFWGAARTVTGSMHLVGQGGRKILLDCGAYRGRRDEDRQPRPFPFRPADLDAVVLSHAHMDHCGNLPRLVGGGFDGPIYCTPATRDLVAVMLGNSSRLEEQDAHVRAVLAGRAAAAPAAYVRQDTGQVIAQCVPVPYDQPFAIAEDIELRFVDAGHILGSAMVSLTFAGLGREWKLTFTGDLGRAGLPLLRDPAAVPEADLVLSESTYGGCQHDPMERTAEELAALVRRTAERGGKVLVPAFSLGRTQSVVHAVSEAMSAGRMPELPVFVDSPLAADVAEVYQKHPDCLDEDADLLESPGVRYIREHEESRELSQRREPCVLVAAGGMCEGGRILQHLKHSIDDPRCTVLLVSYQAPGTPGRRLLERGPTVRFLGRQWNKWADVVELDGFSGHAGHDELVGALAPLAGRAKQVCLVHGEPERAAALAAGLRGKGFAEVCIPEEGQTVSAA